MFNDGSLASMLSRDKTMMGTGKGRKVWKIQNNQIRNFYWFFDIFIMVYK